MQINFSKLIYGKEMYHCSLCQERWFDILTSSPNTFCKVCTASRNSNESPRIGNFSAANDMNPYIHNLHLGLPTLTRIEEALIALVDPVMRVYILKNGTRGFQGQIMIFENNIQRFVDSVAMLPLNPKDLPYFIVRNPTGNSTSGGEGYKDFRVRRDAITQWLCFLKGHNNLYRHVVIDDDLLCTLPEDGDIADLL